MSIPDDAGPVRRCAAPAPSSSSSNAKRAASHSSQRCRDWLQSTVRDGPPRLLVAYASVGRLFWGSEGDGSCVANDIIRLSMPSIRMDCRRGETELPLGSSKLGAEPDLRPGQSWPAWQGSPMAFVGQVNLADIAAYDEEGYRPHSGLLSFFCALDDTAAEFMQAPGGWYRISTATSPRSSASPGRLICLMTCISQPARRASHGSRRCLMWNRARSWVLRFPSLSSTPSWIF
jgi:hypothetical protein